MQKSLTTMLTTTALITVDNTGFALMAEDSNIFTVYNRESEIPVLEGDYERDVLLRTGMREATPAQVEEWMPIVNALIRARNEEKEKAVRAIEALAERFLRTSKPFMSQSAVGETYTRVHILLRRLEKGIRTLGVREVAFMMQDPMNARSKAGNGYIPYVYDMDEYDEPGKWLARYAFWAYTELEDILSENAA